MAHLRSASGGGGGPDKTIFTEAALINPARAKLHCLYLHKPGDPLEGISVRAEATGTHLARLPGGAFIDPRQLMGLVRFLHRNSIDILHCHEPKGDAYGTLLSLLPRQLSGLLSGLLPRPIRVITTLHGWTAPRSRKSAFYAAMDRYCLRHLEAVVAVSRPLEQAALKARARRVLYVPNGVDTDRWTPAAGHAQREHPALAAPANLAPDRPWIGYVGRLSDEKAPDRFLRMAALVARKRPEVGIVLAGEGPALENARRLAGELGLAERTLFLGRLEEDAIRGLMSRLTVLVNSSRTEGMPNNVLEAMAMALPVVATAVGGVPDLVVEGETGFLVPSDPAHGVTETRLADRVLSLLDDPALARRLGEAGRARVEREFSFLGRVEAMTTLYETLAGRR
ncbi:glycosyltransferase [Megalodesulfovibrio paquesii]